MNSRHGADAAGVRAQPVAGHDSGAGAPPRFWFVRRVRASADAASFPAAQLTQAARARAEGSALFKRGKYNEADAAFSDGLEKLQLVNLGFECEGPGAALLHANRSLARAAVGRFREALLDIDAALVCSPNDAAFAERRVTVIRALNRAAAFNADKDANTRLLMKGEDQYSTGML